MKNLNQLLAGISILILIILISGCLSSPSNSNEQTGGEDMVSKTPESVGVKAGDTVQLYYIGYTMENGKKEIFDQTSPGSPAEFQAGVGMLIKGFDSALIGMKAGDKKTIEIPAEEAYGEYDEKLVVPALISDLNQAGIKVEVGTKVQIQTGAQGEIIDVNSTHARINFNHPLAGKTLFFDLELVKILK